MLPAVKPSRSGGGLTTGLSRSSLERDVTEPFRDAIRGPSTSRPTRSAGSERASCLVALSWRSLRSCESSKLPPARRLESRGAVALLPDGLTGLKLAVQNLLVPVESDHIEKHRHADVLAHHVSRAIAHHHAAGSWMEAIDAIDVVLVRAIEETGRGAAGRKALSIERAADDPMQTIVPAAPAASGITNRKAVARSVAALDGTGTRRRHGRLDPFDPQVRLPCHLHAEQSR